MGSTALETRFEAGADAAVAANASISKLVAPLLRSRNPLLRAAMKWRCRTHDDRTLPRSNSSSLSSPSMLSLSTPGLVGQATVATARARLPHAADWALDNGNGDESGSDSEGEGEGGSNSALDSALVGVLMASIRSAEPTHAPSIRSIRCLVVLFHRLFFLCELLSFRPVVLNATRAQHICVPIALVRVFLTTASTILTDCSDANRQCHASSTHACLLRAYPPLCRR
jgi:hypothetical protein